MCNYAYEVRTSQAECRGFESRLPLHFPLPCSTRHANHVMVGRAASPRLCHAITKRANMSAMTIGPAPSRATRARDRRSGRLPAAGYRSDRHLCSPRTNRVHRARSASGERRSRRAGPRRSAGGRLVSRGEGGAVACQLRRQAGRPILNEAGFVQGASRYREPSWTSAKVFPSGSLNHAPRLGPSWAIRSIVLGESYSSKVTPRERSSRIVASRSGT
jgi:hypothetical protein